MSHIQDAVATTEAVNEILSIVIFGSVARGQADRQSDINLFVVDGDRTSARRVVTDVVADLRE